MAKPIYEELEAEVARLQEEDRKGNIMSEDMNIEKIKTLLKERRKLLNVTYWQGEGIEAELLTIFRTYENNMARTRDNVDKYLEHILAAMYGIRFCVNAMLNETWTHRQKDAQMLAIGAMVETAIAHIKEDQHEVATRYNVDDPFTPSWSRDGIYKRATDAEAKVQDLLQRVRNLEDKLVASGIDPADQTKYSTDDTELS